MSTSSESAALSSRRVRISAPGKLFLTGEYAVLWGAPAVVAAVSPRLEARATRQAHALTVRVPGAHLRGHGEGEAIVWDHTPRGARFVMEVLQRAGWPRCADLELSFSPGRRDPQGRKLGLGSSAAASVVAAAGALWRPGTEPARDAIFRLAAEAHWLAQNRAGSGGDVAASTFGGLVSYRRWPVELAAAERPMVQCREVPLAKPVHLALVSSGSPASTPSLVAAVEASLNPGDRTAIQEESASLTTSFEAALQEGNAALALSALNASGDLLAKLGQRTQTPLLTPALASLQGLGRGFGLGAKISGAGGGDSVVWMSFDPDPLTRALQRARESGNFCMELSIEGGVDIAPV